MALLSPLCVQRPDQCLTTAGVGGCLEWGPEGLMGARAKDSGGLCGTDRIWRTNLWTGQPEVLWFFFDFQKVITERELRPLCLSPLQLLSVWDSSLSHLSSPCSSLRHSKEESGVKDLVVSRYLGVCTGLDGVSPKPVDATLLGNQVFAEVIYSG